MAGLLPVFIGGLFNYSLNATFKECVKKRHIREMTVKIFGEDNFTGIGEFDGEEEDIELV